MVLSISGKIGSGKDTTGKIIQILIDCPHFDNNAVKVFLEREILNPSFTIEKWGGVLKDMVCLLISCTREQLEDEEFKNKELGRDWRQYYITDAKYNRINTIKYLSEKEVQEKLETLNHKALNYDYIGLTPRLLLQLLGTECGRNIIHPNIWVNALMSRYKPHCKTYCARQTQPDDAPCAHELDCDCIPNWIITDTRFPNEHKAVIDKGGINIRINRPKERELIIRNAPSIIDTRKPLEPEHESETALDNATFDYTIENNGTLDELISKVRGVLITLELI